jgi:hypothetical protein
MRIEWLARAGMLTAILGIAGCGGSDPSPVVPDLVGEFTGTWTQDLVVSGQSVPTLTCPCVLTVPSQTGNSFFGRSALSSPCDQGLIAGQGRGGVLSISDGRIEQTGALTFRFSEDPRVGQSAGGCTVTAMPPFSGALSGSTVTAQRTEAYDCTVADGNQYVLTVRLSATR